MLDITVDYVKERKQFGVPIGSFQAVKHHLADARLALEFARPLVYRAAWSLAHRRPPTRASHVSMAKALASDAAALRRRGRRCSATARSATHRVRPAPLHEAGLGARRRLGRRRLAPGPRRPRDPVTRTESRSTDARGLHRRRRAHPGRQARRRAGAGPPGRPRRPRRSTRSIDRTDIDPAAVEDVVFGCVDTIGPQAGDIARTCWLAAGLPDEVPGTTVDRQCGSSQQAVHFAAQAVMSGTADLVVAGGVQNMSMIPIASAMLVGRAVRLHRPVLRLARAGWRATATRRCRSSASAEMIAEKWDISREDMEAFALESHRARASGRIDEGRFEREIVPLGERHRRRGPAPRARRSRRWRRCQTLVEGGRLTAAVSSQISDAAAAMLVVVGARA